ncbi:MAG: GNAT family N-acetyltransferase [Hydrogenovibrio sp.]|uniref:GNAT family N-acetyltransferase n=1 Tax=Hydrogenovibrio sp. TaxID=2065821 RepID=UPI0028707419|nr:GNAT family N-acetyltransferase [Hydrogenovibrio sp.]MDR9499122.1 GNAT family N-acetyltransferase [Hydrogenovibrio sp.]
MRPHPDTRVQCVQAPDPRFVAANHFLKRFRQTPAPRNATLWCAHTPMDGCVGAVWVQVMDQTSLWLRSLYVHPEHRRQGLGQTLLRQLLSEVAVPDEKTFAPSQLVAFVPNRSPHLSPFYQGLGFRLATATALPDSLRQRWLRTQAQGKDWQLLVHALSPID